MTPESHAPNHPPPVLRSMDPSDPDGAAHIAEVVELWATARRRFEGVDYFGDAIPKWDMVSCTEPTPQERIAETIVTPQEVRARFTMNANRGVLYWRALDASWFEAQASAARRRASSFANSYNTRQAGTAVVGEIVGEHRRVRLSTSTGALAETGKASRIVPLRMDRIMFCLTYGAWPSPDGCVTCLVPPEDNLASSIASSLTHSTVTPESRVRATDTLRPDMLIYAARSAAEREHARRRLPAAP